MKSSASPNYCLKTPLQETPISRFPVRLNEDIAIEAAPKSFQTGFYTPRDLKSGHSEQT
jgi:hypothetical protein